MLTGKTSNIDLDRIMKHYLPAGSWTRADSVRRMTSALSAEIIERAKTTHVYIPLFARHHWVAGILHDNVLELFDSAPSPPVRKDIFLFCKKFFPNVTVASRPCPHQRRGSEDCGIFVLATFIGHASASPIKMREDLTTRLRQVFASECLPPLHAVRSILSPPVAILKGGSTSDIETAWKAASRLEGPASEQNLCAALAAHTLVNFRNGIQTPPLSIIEKATRKRVQPTGRTRDGRDIFPQQDIGDIINDISPEPDALALISTNNELLSKPVPHPDTRRFLVLGTVHVDPLGFTVGGHIPSAIELPEGTAFFMLGATYKGLTEDRGGFVHSYNGHFAITKRADLSVVGVYELQAEPPVARVTETAIAAARSHDTDDLNNSHPTDDDDVTATDAPKELTPGAMIKVLKQARVGDRVHITWKPRAARQKPIQWVGTVEAPWTDAYRSLAVLWDQGLERLGNRRRRVLPEARLPDPSIIYLDVCVLPGPPPKPKTVPSSKPKDAKQPKEPQKPAIRETAQVSDPASGHSEVLANPPVAPLHPNGTGRPDEGSVCPRLWYIYPDKPPHVSLLAWNAVAVSTRNEHRRWIRDLRSMPADLLSRSLPSAALELVRRISVARRWRWSTHARALANIQSALLALPLYTNQLRGINLDAYPEWRAAKRTAVRYEKEVPPNPPPPLSKQQYDHLRQLLKKNPRAELFATLLWTFAARAGDIGGLRRSAIQIAGVTRTGESKVILTYRTGKGTRFRGPYDAPSLLTPQEVAELRRAMNLVSPEERLFPDTAALRTAVRTALKTIDPKLSLPSLRKGAARNLALLGVPEVDIARVMGHKNLDTLRRYLGYGENPTIESHNLLERLSRLQQQARA